MFKADRSLINSKFEGYKLDPIEQADHVFSYPLPCQVSQATVSTSTRTGSTHLPFEEMRSRIRHNYLSMGLNGEALYIDEDMGVNIIRIQGGQPSFTRVCELPNSIQTDSVSVTFTNPSAVCIGDGSWLVSVGSGHLYLLTKDEASSHELAYQIQEIFDFLPSSEDTTAYPFVLHAAIVREDSVIALVSSKPPGVPNPNKSKNKSVLYRLHAITVPLPRSRDNLQGGSLRPTWTLHGRDLPLSVEYSEPHKAFLVLASASYGITAPELSEYTPKPDEIAPIPQSNEDLNALSIPQPPPYSWTQASDSVTIAFPLPAGISTREINVQLARKALTILVKPSQSVDQSLILPRYALKELWGEIKVTESLWTWDSEDDHTYGLLTLHLEKGHEGTRWPQVFISEGIEVTETVDPSELAKIRDLLEKYTTGQEDLGLGRGVPSLAEGEMDEELDSNVGRSIIPTWITESGRVLGAPRDRMPFIVLSTPMPQSPQPTQVPSITVKQAVDGLLLTATPAIESGAAPQWTHTESYSALSFVLASKRDVKFTYHSDSAVLAFESGASGNLYIYKQTPKGDDRWAKQVILKASGGIAGSLLGAGVVTHNGQNYVLVLCERELKVIKQVI